MGKSYRRQVNFYAERGGNARFERNYKASLAGYASSAEGRSRICEHLDRERRQGVLPKPRKHHLSSIWAAARYEVPSHDHNDQANPLRDQ